MSASDVNFTQPHYAVKLSLSGVIVREVRRHPIEHLGFVDRRTLAVSQIGTGRENRMKESIRVCIIATARDEPDPGTSRVKLLVRLVCRPEVCEKRS